jgi:2-keto-3-deoxy-L-rhamnonate aldolase RhmA
LDGVFIGPADLSASMGKFPNTTAPEVEAVVARVLEKARAAGKPVGYYCNDGATALQRAEQGFRMLNVGNDMSYLVGAARSQLAAVKLLRVID